MARADLRNGAPNAAHPRECHWEEAMTRYLAMSIQLASFVLVAALIGGATQAQAQSYPTKPVRIISDSAPGSAIDTNLRIIAEGLSAQWGQQVVVENRPGAGGAISATVAAEAAPDGYTIYAPALSVFLTIPGKAPNLPVQTAARFHRHRAHGGTTDVNRNQSQARHQHPA